MTMPSSKENDTRKLSFPTKLYKILKASDHGHHTEIIGWLPDGDAFTIHSEQDFCDVVMKNYFKQTNFKSFTRQLYLYGFLKTSSGPESRIFHHPQFLRSNPQSCIAIKRNQFVGDRRQSKSRRLSKTKVQDNKLPPKLPLTTKTPGTGGDFVPPLLSMCDSSWRATMCPQVSIGSVSFASKNSSQGDRNASKDAKYVMSVLDQAFRVMGELDGADAAPLSHNVSAATIQGFHCPEEHVDEEDTHTKLLHNIEATSSFHNGFDLDNVLVPRPIEEMIRFPFIQEQDSILQK
jgi:HSF-type DNA-binding